MYARKLDRALAQGAEIARNHPGNLAFLSNYMLYALYAGQFELASAQAEKLLEADKKQWQPYLVQAMAALAEGKLKQVEKLYKRMAKLGRDAESRAYAARADAALLAGDFERAGKLLARGIEIDEKEDYDAASTWKRLYLAKAELGRGDAASAVNILKQAVNSSEQVKHLLPAALLLIELREFNAALAIQAQLASGLPRSSRAAAALINGVIAMSHGEAVAAVDSIKESIDLEDTWLARYFHGRAYADAGYFAEALGEFEKAQDRIGESTALFLDEVPTFHYSAPLYYWLAFTKQQIGMRGEALQDYQKYLSYRDRDDESPNTKTARLQVDELEL
jgi:tetratricopeptide (TPR) repeat protein